MNSSFIQIFDVKDDAKKALAFISGAFPGHAHSMIETSNQIQIWTKIAGTSDTRVLGGVDKLVDAKLRG